ncbi:MAG: GNAT family N-acetyltransferase [Bacteroidota bacterium]
MVLRQEVFIIEQNCPYLDVDGKDQAAHHLMIRDEEGLLIAYTRLLPKGISYESYSSIGRVVTAQSVRGSGIGKFLMQQSIQWIKQLYPEDQIKISAQCYLLRFYQSFGFQPMGEQYLEDDIPHIAMIRTDESR